MHLPGLLNLQHSSTGTAFLKHWALQLETSSSSSSSSSFSSSFLFFPLLSSSFSFFLCVEPLQRLLLVISSLPRSPFLLSAGVGGFYFVESHDTPMKSQSARKFSGIVPLKWSVASLFQDAAGSFQGCLDSAEAAATMACATWSKQILRGMTARRLQFG